MFKYPNLTYSILLMVAYITIGKVSPCAQQKNISVSIQQGHSDDISLIALSNDLRFFASYGKDNKVVIWDYKTGSQMAFSYVSSILQGITFNEASTHLSLLSSSNETQLLEIASMQFITRNLEPKPTFRDKGKISFDNKHVVLKNAKISLLNAQTNKVITSKTSDYFDQPFTVVNYHSVTKKIYAGCEDGYIYVYDNQLKLLKQLKQHNSGVNDIAFTTDNKYMFSVSSDRSIIKWNLNKELPEARYTGKNFPLYGASINQSGTKLLFGDEVGYHKAIYLNNSRLEISSARNFIYPLTYTHQLADSSFILAGHDNRLIIEKEGEQLGSIKILSKSPKNAIHWLFTKKLDFYQPPYSYYASVDISPSETNLAISNDIKFNHSRNYKLYHRHIRIYNISQANKIQHSPKLHIKDNPENSTVFFLNDSTLLSAISTKNQLTVWRFKRDNISKVYHKNITLPHSFNHLIKVNTEWVAYTTPTQLIFYQVYTKQILEKSLAGIVGVYSLQNNQIVVSTSDNSFYVAENITNEIHLSKPYTGHENNITSVINTPSKTQLFSTSTDGTLRVWDTQSTSLILSIVPIGFDQCMFITPDKYYMTTTKSLGSFGFKMNEEFFFPEQFDPFYNRPDIILDRLGYADSTLVKAYHQAYLKRLKKMNFHGRNAQR
jgi:WD40 repeat protein